VTPLTYQYGTGVRRLRRPYLFLIASTMGMIAGLVLGVAIKGVCDGQTADREWKRDKITCISSRPTADGTLYVLQNKTTGDFWLSERGSLILMRVSGGTLIRDDANRIELPLFIPLRETAGLIVRGDQADFVLYDTSKRFAIRLCRGR